MCLIYTVCIGRHGTASLRLTSQRNDVTKRHGIVITIWRASAIEVTALSKTHFQK